MISKRHILSWRTLSKFLRSLRIALAGKLCAAPQHPKIGQFVVNTDIAASLDVVRSHTLSVDRKQRCFTRRECNWLTRRSAPEIS